MSPFVSQFLLISAFVILSIGLSLALIGFLIFRGIPRDSKIDDPVSGILEVTGTSARAEHADYQSVTVTGVLIAEGQEPIPVRTKTMVSAEKFPAVGAELPVVFSESNPGTVNIQWDQVLTDGQRAAQVAAQRAEQLSQAQTPPSSSPPPKATSEPNDSSAPSSENLW